MSGRSIQRQVLWWALGALALGAALQIAFSWWLLRQEMEEVFEDNLKQVALAVVHHHRVGGNATPPRLAQELPRVYEEFGRFEFVTAVWSREGHLVASSDPGVVLPFLSRSGLTEARAGGDRWYLYTIVLEDGKIGRAHV